MLQLVHKIMLTYQMSFLITLLPLEVKQVQVF